MWWSSLQIRVVGWCWDLQIKVLSVGDVIKSTHPVPHGASEEAHHTKPLLASSIREETSPALWSSSPFACHSPANCSSEQFAVRTEFILPRSDRVAGCINDPMTSRPDVSVKGRLGRLWIEEILPHHLILSLWITVRSWVMKAASSNQWDTILPMEFRKMQPTFHTLAFLANCLLFKVRA